MPKIKHANAFTPDGSKKAARILYHIVDRIALGNVSIFTEMFNQSLKSRGYKSNKKGEEDNPLTYDHSSIDKLINIWNPRRKAKLKSINCLHFHYFEPFYPTNLTVQDMIDIACGFRKPPKLNSLKFPQKTNIGQEDSSKVRVDVSRESVVCHNYFAAENNNSLQLLYIVKTKEKQVDKRLVFPLSVSEVDKLSLLYKATSVIKNDSVDEKQEDPALTSFFSSLAQHTLHNDDNADKEIFISIEVLEKISSYCFKVARWEEMKPILCLIHTYEGEWENMIKDLNNISLNGCICKI